MNIGERGEMLVLELAAEKSEEVKLVGVKDVIGRA